MAGANGAEGVVLGPLSKSPLFMFHAALWLIISPVHNPPPTSDLPSSHSVPTEGLIVGGELTLSTLNQTLTWSLRSVIHLNRWGGKFTFNLTHTHPWGSALLDMVFNTLTTPMTSLLPPSNPMKDDTVLVEWRRGAGAQSPSDSP